MSTVETRLPGLAGAAAGVPGLLAVLTTVLVAPGGLAWFVAVVGAVAVVPGMVRRAIGFFEPLTFLVVIIGAAGAAVSGRLPVPVALLIGVLLLVYAIAIEFADETAGSTALAAGALRGWGRTVVPLLGVGVAGGAFVGVILLLPIQPLAVAVFVAPLALILAAVLAFGSRLKP